MNNSGPGPAVGLNGSVPSSDLLAQSARLPDGRLIGYAEFGDRAGVPFLFFHGEPGSRLSGDLLASHARACGVRLIAPDRPGFGLSTFQPGRTRAHWAADVEHLADMLDLDRFGVIGWSAGGPYALACGAAISHRVRVVGVLAGVGRLGNFDPAMVKGLLRIRPGGNLDDLPEVMARAWTRTRAAAGSWVEAAQESAGTIAAGMREAMRDGPAGVLHELRLLARSWEFDPTTIAGVPVRFWHGKADAVVPARHTRRLAAQLPGSQATFYPAAGHVSLLTVHGREILQELLRASA